MHIGLIYTGYGTRDLVPKSLEPWVNLRVQWMGQFDRRSSIRICAVSVKFAGFDGEDDGTTDLLHDHLTMGDIDHLIDDPQNVLETTARGMALQYLKQQGCDIIWQIDSDEFYTEDQIYHIIHFVEQNPWIIWFRLSLKNLVFDSRTYLAEPFTPPRIHRVVSGSYKVHSFSGDNDIAYGGTITRDIIPQDRLPSQVVPKEIAWIAHDTWTADTPERAARVRAKISYQRKRWGDTCSFTWDDSKGGLIFNPNLPEPKVIHD